MKQHLVGSEEQNNEHLQLITPGGGGCSPEQPTIASYQTKGWNIGAVWQLKQEKIGIRAALCRLPNGVCLVFRKQQGGRRDTSGLRQWALMETFTWELVHRRRGYRPMFISFSGLVNWTQTQTHAPPRADVQTLSLAQGHTSVWSVWFEGAPWEWEASP